MPKRATGLYKRWSKGRAHYWWEIDKTVNGRRIRVSTGTSDYAEAERRLAYEIDQARKSQIYGIAQKHTFAQAAARYLDENSHKRALNRDITALDMFIPHVGEMPLHQVHQGTLQKAIDKRRQHVSNSTVNRDLSVIRRILALSAQLWRDETGQPWLATVPMIATLPTPKKRRPYPLTWDEQRLLFRELPAYLERMALFAVHTGMRAGEIRQARWSWEATIDGHTVLIIPPEIAKNGHERIVVCNRVAQSVIDGQRGQSGTWVFPSPRTGGPLSQMRNKGWCSARERAASAYPVEIGGKAPWGFAHVRVHDLRHTFGRRLRAADVPEETRKDLIGHRTQSITTEYSAAEIHNLIDAANTVCDGKSRPMLRMVRETGVTHISPARKTAT